MLCALDFATASPREVVLAGDLGSEDLEALRGAVDRSPELNRVLAHADREESLADLVPILADRGGPPDPARAWVCRDFACGLPISEPDALAKALDG
jgi:uncharacterized protein YyaL (SSP411 family)